MDLINDLENEMAFAFFVEKKHSQKIDSRESLALIRNIRSSLLKVAAKSTDSDHQAELEKAARGMHG
ncbi:MAG: hypothetical protein WBD16_05105 [Pyrinomonadaceae bacterium]